MSTTLLPDALATFHATYPGVALTLREAGSDDLVGLLEAGELDLAAIILPIRHPILQTLWLLEEELVLAVPRGHPFGERSEVRLADLKDQPIVMFRDGYDLRATTLVACRRAGFEPSVALDGGEMDSVLRFVAAGLGVAVVPSIVIEPAGAVCRVPIRVPRLTRTIALAHRRDRNLSRAAHELVTILRQACAPPSSGRVASGTIAHDDVTPSGGRDDGRLKTDLGSTADGDG